MRHYTIVRTQGAPDWESVPALSVDNHLWSPEIDIRMTAQICYDADGLYIRQVCRESDIRAVHDAPLSMVCEDSCMEFFFGPDGEDLRYFNFEVNPNGRTYIGFGHDRYDSVRLFPQEEAKFLKMNAFRMDGGWEVRYRIPLSFLRIFFPGLTLRAGLRLRANCYKCGDLTAQPHFIAWNPIDHPTPDFHRPEQFGLMELA